MIVLLLIMINIIILLGIAASRVRDHQQAVNGADGQQDLPATHQCKADGSGSLLAIFATMPALVMTFQARNIRSWSAWGALTCLLLPKFTSWPQYSIMTAIYNSE